MVDKILSTRSLLIALLSGALVILMSSISFAVELRLTDDARTEFGQPTTPLGTNNQNLRVSGVANAWANSYLKFDYLSVLPTGTVGSDVVKATLKLWTDTVGTSGSFEVHRVNAFWAEETITWNNQPTPGTTDGTGTVTKSLSFTTVDVTQLVKDWLDGVEVNNGLALVAVGGTNVPFDSKEDPQRGHEPQLEVTLAGDITAVLAGTGLTGGGTKGDVTLNVDTNFIQNRVAGSCAIGSSIRVINVNGTVECEIDDNSGGTVTSVSAGSGLTAAPNPITTTGTISVATGGITSAMLAANSVDSSKIVDGSVGSADVNSAQVQLRVSGICAVGSAIQLINADGTVACQATGGIGGSGTANTIAKFTAPTTIGNSAVFETGGNVGIGTASPTARLTVEVPGGVNPIRVRSTEVDGNPGIHIQNDAREYVLQTTGARNDNFEIWDQNSSATRLAITTAGNVGIGTAGPGARLDVRGPATGQLRVYSDTDLTLNGGKQQQSEIRLYGSWAGSALALGAIRSYTVGSGPVDQGILSFATANNGVPVDRVTIDANGNVGIGTTSPTSLLDVAGTLTAVSKNFQIDHPLVPDKKLLVHSALEGPEVAVYYRGEAQLENGEVSINLPSYFEALTRKEQRTVQLTPIKGWAPLYVADEIQDGKFTVRTANGGDTAQRFYWEVKAVRADVTPLVVEKLKENMRVAAGLK